MVVRWIIHRWSRKKLLCLSGNFTEKIEAFVLEAENYGDKTEYFVLGQCNVFQEMHVHWGVLDKTLTKTRNKAPLEEEEERLGRLYWMRPIVPDPSFSANPVV